MPIRYPLVAALLIVLILIGTHPVIGMESTHFKISTSVISGGGTLTESDSFRLISTLGQSTPLMDPADPPYSDNFDAYPGFWYTVAPALGGYCIYDFESDGDVDGKDLAEFIQDFNSGMVAAGDLADFSVEFGGSPCVK
jgi:hypothetical protein